MLGQFGRCGGEWSECIREFGVEYLRERIHRLHPELGEGNVDQTFEEAKHRVWPEHPDGPPKLYRAVLAPKDDMVDTQTFNRNYSQHFIELFSLRFQDTERVNLGARPIYSQLNPQSGQNTREESF